MMMLVVETYLYNPESPDTDHGFHSPSLSCSTEVDSLAVHTASSHFQSCGDKLSSVSPLSSMTHVLDTIFYTSREECIEESERKLGGLQE